MTKSNSTIKSSLKKDDLIQLYKDMLFYRRFEEKANTAYTKQKFSGFLHLHIGQEAVCAGVAKTMEPKDYCISGYRSHTQAIAKGISAKSVFSELFGKVSGCSRAKGGSMHMFSKEKRFFGGHGIVGGQAPLAVGAAFASKYCEDHANVVCYLGDAAMNQGQVFEAMNMAATWSLPVLFVIENNQYGMGTSIKRTTSVDHLYKRALGFDMQHSQVGGMNCIEIYEHVAPIMKKMRDDKKPHLLEVLTYRYKGHSVSDPASYRSKEELKSFQDQDPITQLQKYLLEEKMADEDQCKNWDKEARASVKEAEAFADAAKEPEEQEVWQHVYAD